MPTSIAKGVLNCGSMLSVRASMYKAEAKEDYTIQPNQDA